MKELTTTKVRYGIHRRAKRITTTANIFVTFGVGNRQTKQAGQYLLQESHTTKFGGENRRKFTPEAGLTIRLYVHSRRDSQTSYIGNPFHCPWWFLGLPRPRLLGCFWPQWAHNPPKS